VRTNRWNSIANRLCDVYGHRWSSWLPRGLVTRAALLIKIACLCLVGFAAYAPQPVEAQSLCESCEVQIGVGETYHYWATTGSLVLPVSVTWSDDRYEFAVFRFTGQQLLSLPGGREARHMANPYWGASLSRRWRLFERGPVQGYFGFGLAARTESDDLSVTPWDFASQLGLRFHLPGSPVIGEVTMRHWSNAGIQLPNHGQDFATLTIRVNSGLFGVPKADQIAIDPSLSLDRSMAASGPGPDMPLLP
jgi:hypothetical protein